MRAILMVEPDLLPDALLLSSGRPNEVALDEAVARAEVFRLRRRRRAALRARRDPVFLAALHFAMFGAAFTISPEGVLSTPIPARTLSIVEGNSVLSPRVQVEIDKAFPPHPTEWVLYLAFIPQEGYDSHHARWRAAPTFPPERRFVAGPKGTLRPLLEEFFRRHPSADLS